jgi:hypothetical protein
VAASALLQDRASRMRRDILVDLVDLVDLVGLVVKPFVPDG